MWIEGVLIYFMGHTWRIVESLSAYISQYAKVADNKYEI